MFRVLNSGIHGSFNVPKAQTLNTSVGLEVNAILGFGAEGLDPEPSTLTRNGTHCM